ncbi:MAG: aldo/keto reductase [Oscillospiraceae bacterium]|nr:aldo/keto reductase [Oscillospiraceae bacterium]
MKTIPGTDLSVSALCFGTCPVSLTLEDSALFPLLDRFADAGGNFLDTANVYGKWSPWFDNLSEQRIGRWLATRADRAGIVIATKGAHYDIRDPERTPRVTKQDVEADIDESLRTLGLDCIPFYWLHRDDPARPIEEVVDICEQLRRAGKLRWYGASNFTAARLEAARQYAAAAGIPGFSAVSNQWSLAEVTDLAHNNNPDPTLVLMGPEEYAFHAASGTACIPYQATARGWFAKAAAGTPIDPGVTRAFDTPANRATLAKLVEKAAATGHSVQALALSELAAQPFPVIPVSSASNDAQMDTLLEAMQLLES